MSDLTNRLQWHLDMCHTNDEVTEDIREAKAEIERLTAELAKSKEDFWLERGAADARHAAELAEARAEAEERRNREFSREWWRSDGYLPKAGDPEWVLPWETEFVPKLDEKARPE